MSPYDAASSHVRRGGFGRSCWAWTRQCSAKLPQFDSYAQMRWREHAIGSRPLHSAHSPQLWLQWITTSSPAFHLVTPGPTASTIPDASDPAMWKS